MRRTAIGLWMVVLLGLPGAWADPSPLKPGGLLQPFTSNVVTGEFRGEQHCFVCSLLHNPAVLVFARHMDEPTGRLLHSLDTLLRAHRKSDLVCWMVFLGPKGSEHETQMEGAAETFAAKYDTTFVPVTVLADPTGPPGYRLSEQADLVLIVTEGRKTVSSHVFDDKHWDTKAADAMAADIQNTLHLK